LTMENAFKIETRDNIVYLTIDLDESKVNILSPPVMAEFSGVLDDLAEKKELAGMVIVSGKKNNFIAGADISVIENIASEEEAVALAKKGQEIFNKLEQLPFPTVAAIHGSCLGGGTELALACDYRVISDDRKSFMGLPETSLGIIPGFGATQRLPALVGLSEAIRIITTGTKVFAEQAKRKGLVDEVAPIENILKAATFIIKRHRNGKKRCCHCLPTLLDRLWPWQKIVFAKARELVRKKAGDHYPAPFAAIDAIEEGVKHGREKGLAKEARLLGAMALTPTAKNLQRVFRLHEHYTKGVSGDEQFKHLGVVGAGIMGGSIVALFAERGMQVRLINRSTKGLKTAFNFLTGLMVKKRRKHIYSRLETKKIEDRVTYDTEMRGMQDLQAVIEAVVEDMKVKKEILAKVADKVHTYTLILSNTSSLSISEMATAVPNPERVAGLHFFNPVDQMQLVEVVHGAKTNQETVERTKDLARQLGKLPISVQDRPGFLVNRLLLPYLNEAVRLLEEGVEIDRADHALKKFGMPMGPFQLLDMVGLDIAAHVATILQQGFGERMTPSPLLPLMQAVGRLGRKSGAGFYLYGKSAGKVADPEIYRLLDLNPDKQSSIKDDEIIDRLILAMINEAAYCLDEAVIEEPRAIDAAMIFGAGFPPYTGGLIRYADTVGAKAIVKKLDRFTKKSGKRFEPAPLLRHMAKLDAGFYEQK